jgi:hypothetical protein
LAGGGGAAAHPLSFGQVRRLHRLEGLLDRREGQIAGDVADPVRDLLEG